MGNKKYKNTKLFDEITFSQEQPQGKDLEEAVLGGILLEQDVMDTIAKDFSDTLFYVEANKVIAKAIIDMYQKGDKIDILTISQKLNTNGKLKDIGGAYYISSLTNRVASASNIEMHIKLLQQFALRRSLIGVCGKGVNYGFDQNNDVFDIFATVQTELDQALKEVINHEVASIKDIHIDVVEQSKKVYESGGVSGVVSGLKMVDNITSGWQKSDLIILAGRPSMGKCLVVSSLLYTQDGVTTIGEAKVGQKILGSNGVVAEIKGVYPQGKKTVYRVHFDDNTFVDCCEEHLWEVSSRTDRKASYGNKEMRASVLKTKEMINNIFCSDGRKNYSVKIIKPLNFSEKKITLNPYVLGFYLGDGYSSENSVCISNIEGDIIENFNKLLPINNTLSKKNYKDFGVIKKEKVGTNNDFLKMIKDLGLCGKKSNEKFIPKNYLYNTIEVRTMLLQGLIDTDGHIPTKGRSAIEYSTVSIQLRDDILELVRGLGGKATYLIKKGSYTKNGVKHKAKEYYRMYLSLPPEIMPISSKKHLEKYSLQKRYHRKFITKIEDLGYKEEMICISVDTPDNLYITNGYTLTHNTACAISMITYPAIEKNTPIGVFSLEMSKEQLVGRIQSGLSYIDVGKIVRKHLDLSEISQIEKSCERLLTSPLYIDDTPNISLIELKAKARRLVKEKGVQLIVIDYLQLMRSGLNIGSREQEIAEISRGLKGLAKELDIPIIALSQLSRLVEGRSDKKPQLSDLRESGQIEQDADMVLFCYRPEYYNIDNYDIENENITTDGLFMLIVAKHRNGELGEVPLKFVHRLTKVTNHPRWVSEDIEPPVQETTTRSVIAPNNSFLEEGTPQQTNEEGDILPF